MSGSEIKDLPRRVLITGGAGFIGTNLADRLLRRGIEVRVLDSLARPGVESNLEWLIDQHPQHLETMVADVRDPDALHDAVQEVDHVFHLAAQVAVTSSLSDPRHDFAVNVHGTLNLLEAMRARSSPPSLVFASTNKVYGELGGLRVVSRGERYVPADQGIAVTGIDEDSALEFHSPYGCSKGAAEQYVLDYARSFGLHTVVLRMSCIYGPHQHGTEDQGWVAHFLRSALADREITLYGTGMQVRDVLFVEDFVTALEDVTRRIEALSGRAFNIGGGPRNTTSLLELIDLIQRVAGVRARVQFEGWRTGDQKYYVSNLSRIREATGWAPRVGVEEGLTALHEWLVANASNRPPTRSANVRLAQEARP